MALLLGSDNNCTAEFKPLMTLYGKMGERREKLGVMKW